MSIVDPFFGLADEVAAFLVEVRAGVGTSVLREADGLTYVGFLRDLTGDEETTLVLQGTGSAGPINVADLNLKMLEFLPIDCPIRAGDFLVEPADGDPNADRYHVLRCQAPTYAGARLSRSALLAGDPVHE